MRKVILTAMVLAATVLLTGCGAGAGEGSNSNTPTKTKEIKSQVIETSDRGLRNLVEEDKSFEVVDSGKYPVDYSEFDDEEATSFVYHSDTKEDVENFAKKYKALTGKEFKGEFDGTMVIVKAGFKNDSSYDIEVTMVEKAPRYDIVDVRVTKTNSKFTSDAVSSPFIIVFIPNTHKEAKVVVR